MRHTPTKFPGLGLLEPKIGQETVKLNYMMSRGDAATLSGKISLYRLGQSQLEVGISTPFYELSYSSFVGWKTYWWSTIFVFFVSSEAIVPILSDIKVHTNLSVRKFYIMEAVINICLFVPGYLTQINSCRSYLEVVKFYDVATGYG